MIKKQQFAFNNHGQLTLSPRAPYIELGGASGKNYHIRSDDSHLILSCSAGSTVAISGNITVFGAANTISGTLNLSTDLTASGDIVQNVSGTKIYNNISTLILSASTSTITISSSIDLSVPRAYSIRTINGHLILSSSAGSIVGMSASQDFSNSDKGYHIRAVNSHLSLSSSAGSVVSFSSSQDFPNSDKPYHIRAVNSHLVLSSSIGSVAISGVFRIASDFVGAGVITNDNDGSLKLGAANALGILILSSSGAGARQRVGIATVPNVSAKLDLGGTDGALIIPRLTDAQKTSLTPTNGMLIYSTTSGSFLAYNTTWKTITIV